MDFKASLYDSSGSGITDSTDLDIKIKRDADDYFFDFNDSTFKNSGWTDIDLQMSDIDKTNVPGEYEASVNVSSWTDGVYTVYYVYSGTPAWTSSGEFALFGGLDASLSSAIADAVWNEAKSGHTGSGSFGEEVQAHSLSTEISALNNISTSDVNTQVLDVLNTDTFAEPGQGAPPATTTLVQKIGYLYKFLRNKIETTSTTITVYNDDGTTAGQRSTISDDGTTTTRGEFGSGA